MGSGQSDTRGSRFSAGYWSRRTGDTGGPWGPEPSPKQPTRESLLAGAEIDPGQDPSIGGSQATSEIPREQAVSEASSPAVPALAQPMSRAAEATQPVVADTSDPALLLLAAAPTEPKPPEWHRWVTQALRVPLSTAITWAALDDPTLALAIPGLGQAAVLLMAMPRPTKLEKKIKSWDDLSSDALMLLISAGRDELRQVEGGSAQYSELSDALSALASRTLNSLPASRLSVQQILDISIALTGRTLDAQTLWQVLRS